MIMLLQKSVMMLLIQERLRNPHEFLMVLMLQDRARGQGSGFYFLGFGFT